MRSVTRQETLARLRATAELADKGFYRCSGRCRQVKKLQDGVVVTWGGNILFGICPECFQGIPLVLEEADLPSGGRGILVHPLRKEDRQPVNAIIPASTLSDVDSLVPSETLAKFKKHEIDEE